MPYVPNTDSDREHMLRRIGAKDPGELFEDIPEDLRLGRPLDVPGPLSEQELHRHMMKLASMNRTADDVLSFLGGGVYDTYVPAAVSRITGMPQFYTAYTPYQAEASQGTLQAIYEFQTMVARLTAMEVANASLYDGATATAEAALMAVDVRKRRKLAVAGTLSPMFRDVLRTYVSSLDVEIEELPVGEGATDPASAAEALSGAAALIVQHPNFFGSLEPMKELGRQADSAGALLVAVVDPLSLLLLSPPGEYGADIAVGEGQSLGAPMGYGGPLLGFMATRRKYLRKMPGRIIGATEDADGRRGYVMTLQTREQHIRREKATSNICTNQALVALGATVYMSLLGARGLRELALRVSSTAHYAAAALSRIDGVSLRFPRPFFREFAVRLPFDARRVKAELAEAGIWPGLSCGCYYEGLDDCLLVSVSETHGKHDVDTLTSAIRAVVEQGDGR
ncbi:MAG: aminomethyl-transferring glycine dehydrogenase subunit GcvPA [Candidatus Eisenbacteria bacterium]|nr:aminomethyl-transferring glycine dehydrogenase subunit GcvPA [Candidatus Eisenbacteria bacterium]